MKKKRSWDITFNISSSDGNLPENENLDSGSVSFQEINNSISGSAECIPNSL